VALSEIEFKTLTLLAYCGPLTGYDLHSKKKGDGTGVNASTVIMSDVHWLTVRKKLLKYGLIEELENEGRRKPYRLSEDGFDLILRSRIADIDDFEKFASNYKGYFPLVFGLWEKLKRYELDEYVKDSIVDIIERIYIDIIRELKLETRERYSHEEFVEDISARIYIPDLYVYDVTEFNVQILSKINSFSNAIPIVKAFIEKRISEESNKIEQKLDRIKHVKKNHLILN